MQQERFTACIRIATDGASADCQVDRPLRRVTRVGDRRPDPPISCAYTGGFPACLPWVARQVLTELTRWSRRFRAAEPYQR